MFLHHHSMQRRNACLLLFREAQHAVSCTGGASPGVGRSHGHRLCQLPRRSARLQPASPGLGRQRAGGLEAAAGTASGARLLPPWLAYLHSLNPEEFEFNIRIDRTQGQARGKESLLIHWPFQRSNEVARKVVFANYFLNSHPKPNTLNTMYYNEFYSNLQLAKIRQRH